MSTLGLTRISYGSSESVDTFSIVRESVSLDTRTVRDPSWRPDHTFNVQAMLTQIELDNLISFFDNNQGGIFNVRNLQNQYLYKGVLDGNMTYTPINVRGCRMYSISFRFKGRRL